MREHDGNTHTEVTQEVTQKRAPLGQHLYVFQDATGLIKIGRSSQIDKRRRAMEQTIGRKLYVAFRADDRGCEEKAIMAKVADHRCSGEWFENSNKSRKAIVAAIGCAIDWPLPPERRDATWREKKQKEKDREGMQAAVDKLLAQIEAEGPYKGRNARRREMIMSGRSWPFGERRRQ